jgi:aldehyde dehydrogenase (NAD+)
VYESIVNDAQEAFKEWRLVPAPERGELVRQMGNALRDHKQSLGELVTYEMGKITAEGLGEVQEAIDIADFAVGLSRQLYGKTMHSERRLHRMYEQWHPLGSIGVITAFNFPVAVWAWNSMISAVCGNATIWKASELTPITAFAAVKICREVLATKGFEAIFSLVTGGKELGVAMAADRRLPLISATGSCAMGKAVAAVVGSRLGRVILELGGNNAVTVLADADLDLVVRGTLFGAVGTAGQRCTTTRRLLVEQSVVDSVADRLCKAYQQVRIGDPRKSGTLVGPLVSSAAVTAYQKAIARIPQEGGKILYGGEVLSGMPSANYVQPTLVLAMRGMPLLQEETFAPILYIVPVSGLDEAIAVNNEVAQGLSSSIFTSNFRSSERFLSHAGSDCGIANVNIGTSGAEIGGAFGGEKDTGGGREAGSDSWKQYMRRQTCTLNFGTEMPLAQGVVFS